jgi:hypothetical protein
MSKERLKVSVSPEYAAAIGLAIYCFASLEWHAVWCCERIEPGSLDALEDRTAGRVGDTLLHLVDKLEVSEGQRVLREAAADFRALVSTRNNLVHAKPGTDTEGRQALYRHGDQWMISELENVADAFAACAIRLSAALNSVLGPSDAPALV